MLSEATWVWTEFEGKYHGCEYWSEAAWKLQDQQKMLVHEHAVPKSLVIQRLLELSNPTADSVNQLLVSFLQRRRFNERGRRPSQRTGTPLKNASWLG